MSLNKYIWYCDFCGATYTVQQDYDGAGWGRGFTSALVNLIEFIVPLIQNEYDGLPPCCNHVSIDLGSHNESSDIDDKFEDKVGTVYSWNLCEKKMDRFESILE